MMKTALSFFPFKFMPLIGLALFISVFVGVVVWVNRKGSKPIYEKMSHIPLGE